MWHNVHSQQHTYMSSSYRSNRLGLSHWDPYAVCRGGCLELYYCNMVKWFWCDSSLILTTNWFPSVLWHCWFGHLACNEMTYNVLSGTLNLCTTTTITVYCFRESRELSVAMMMLSCALRGSMQLALLRVVYRCLLMSVHILHRICSRMRLTLVDVWAASVPHVFSRSGIVGMFQRVS